MSINSAHDSLVEMEGIQALGYRDYISRLPNAPSIHVPPPTDLAPQDHCSPPSFLPANAARYGAMSAISRSTGWEYSDRRKVQQILPYLYLGPMTITKEATWFQEYGITMALGVRSKLTKLLDPALQRVRDMGLEVQYVDVPDQSHLIKVFPHAINMIKDHMIRLSSQQRLGRVLVFCESGNDRSASVVAAFTMEVHSDVDHIKAIQLCQSQRFCAMFNEENKRILQSYWDILSAQRSVRLAQNQQPLSSGVTEHRSVKKRQLEENYEQDVDGVRNYAPFSEEVDF